MQFVSCDGGRQAMDAQCCSVTKWHLQRQRRNRRSKAGEAPKGTTSLHTQLQRYASFLALLLGVDIRAKNVSTSIKDIAELYSDDSSAKF